MTCLLPPIQRVFYFMESKKSGIKGITWRKDKRKWLVRTTIDGEPAYGGYFSKEEQAVQRLKEINPKLFMKNAKRISAERKKEVREAKAYYKLNKIRDIKYNTKTDLFEVITSFHGEKKKVATCYSSDEALKKYNFYSYYEKFYVDESRRRRGLKPILSRKIWIASIFIKGKRQEVGKFDDYLDALEAVAEAERDNPDCDLI